MKNNSSLRKFYNIWVQPFVEHPLATTLMVALPATSAISYAQMGRVPIMPKSSEIKSDSISVKEIDAEILKDVIVDPNLSALPSDNLEQDTSRVDSNDVKTQRVGHGIEISVKTVPAKTDSGIVVTDTTGLITKPQEYIQATTPEMNITDGIFSPTVYVWNGQEGSSPLIPLWNASKSGIEMKVLDSDYLKKLDKIKPIIYVQHLKFS